MKYSLKGEESKRLTYRLLTDDDFDEWKKLFINEDVALFLGLDPLLSATELCKKWFEKTYHRYENNLGAMNVLISKETGKLIGQCGILVQDIQGEERIEIGYSVLPEYWGQGFATEAAIKCKEFAFENNFTDSLISVVNVGNIGSERVALKNNMLFEKKIENFKGSKVNIFRVDKH